MKTRLLIIIGIITIGFGMSSAYAAPLSDFAQAFEYSDYVILGKIDSVNIIAEPVIDKTETTYFERSGIVMYAITVMHSYKNPDNITHITVPGKFLREPHPMAYETYPYNVGDVVNLYIQKNTGSYIKSDLIIRSANSSVEFECTKAVAERLPTAWVYRCYDEPIFNPQRYIDIQNSKREQSCADGEIYHAGICMTPEVKEKSLEINNGVKTPEFPEEPEPPSFYDDGVICPPDKVLEWDICVDECRFGQIANSHRICEDIAPPIEITPVTVESSLIPIFIIIGVSIGMVVIYIINAKRKSKPVNYMY